MSARSEPVEPRETATGKQTERGRRLKELYHAYDRRLHALQLRSAQQGYEAPPSVALEIKDIQEILRKIARQYQLIESSPLPDPAFEDDQTPLAPMLDSVSRMKVTIVIEGEYSGRLSREQEQLLRRMIAAVADVAAD